MPCRSTDDTGRMFLLVLIILVVAECASAQQPKLRPLRIALPSNTIAATHFYVGKSLGIFESHDVYANHIVVAKKKAAAAFQMSFRVQREIFLSP